MAAPEVLAAARTTPRTVFAGESAGVRWAVRVGQASPGRPVIVLTRTCRGVTVTSGVPCSPPRAGQFVSMWLGRPPQAPGGPAFLLLRAAPDVARVTALLASGSRRLLALSPLFGDLRLRFGAAPLPGEDPLAAVEAVSPVRGTLVTRMWHPPVRRASA